MLVKPFWPIAEYVMNYDYIVNVLCENKDQPQLNCDGKCYLSKQLAKESQQSKENPFSDHPTKTELHQILYFGTVLNFQTYDALHFKTKSIFGYPERLNTLLFVFEIIQPPELLW